MGFGLSPLGRHLAALAGVHRQGVSRSPRGRKAQDSRWQRHRAVPPELNRRAKPGAGRAAEVARRPPRDRFHPPRLLLLLLLFELAEVVGFQAGPIRLLREFAEPLAAG